MRRAPGDLPISNLKNCIHEKNNGHTILKCQRPNESKRGRENWKHWGLIFRAPMGHRARRTTRRTVTPGNICRTTMRAARVSLGEDGIAGISDDQQRLCFSLALWNGCDPILKSGSSN